MECLSSDRGITLTLTVPEAESLLAYLDLLPACEVVRTMKDSQSTGTVLTTLLVLHGELRRPSSRSPGKVVVRAPRMPIAATV